MRLWRCPEPSPQLSVTEILFGVGLAMGATLILEVNQVNATLPSPRCRVPYADPVCLEICVSLPLVLLTL